MGDEEGRGSSTAAAMTYRTGLQSMHRRGRADMDAAGCASLEPSAGFFPCPRLRVADRGLREGCWFR